MDGLLSERDIAPVSLLNDSHFSPSFILICLHPPCSFLAADRTHILHGSSMNIMLQHIYILTRISLWCFFIIDKLSINHLFHFFNPSFSFLAFSLKICRHWRIHLIAFPLRESEARKRWNVQKSFANAEVAWKENKRG